VAAAHRPRRHGAGGGRQGRLMALAARTPAAAAVSLAVVVAFALALAAAAPLHAQPQPQPQPPGTPVAERVATDLREAVQRLPVTVKDGYGRRETVSIAVTVYRPPGDGPFPLAVVAHGRAATPAARAAPGRQRFESLARYLADKGFAVLVPTRVGYGETAMSAFDPEDSGPCNQRRFEPMVEAGADQVQAVLDDARRQPWADATRWIVVGESVGGTVAMAVAARAPAGLKAAINFSGGSGGDPVGRPANPCSPHLLQRLWQAQAGRAALPVLWIYWTHDRYWGEALPRGWAQAWRDGGGRIEFHQLPPWSAEPAEGHGGLGRDMDHWVPLAEAYLAQAGFAQPGAVARPPASGYARLDEADKLPLRPAAREPALARFQALAKPRALAVGPSGFYGWASGDWAAGRALGHCAAAGGQPCKLYAVDDDVVWVP